MKTSVIVLIVAALSLAGCATPTHNWAKAGATQADLDRDMYECQRDANMIPSRQSPYGGYVALVRERQDQDYRVHFSEQCLKSKGWRKVGGK